MRKIKEGLPDSIIKTVKTGLFKELKNQYLCVKLL
jgi:hypothetical protein